MNQNFPTRRSLRNQARQTQTHVSDTHTPSPADAAGPSTAATIPSSDGAASAPHVADAKRARGRFFAKQAKSAPANRARGRHRRVKKWRSTAIVALVVPGIFGTIALPAYAMQTDAADVSRTVLVNAQSLTVGSQVETVALTRDSYSATSSEELAANRAAEEAAQAAEAAKRAAASAGGGTGQYTGDPNGTDLSNFLATASSEWIRPLDVPISSGYGPRAVVCNGAGCSTPFHYGIDFPTACGTPIKAVSSGRVTFVGNGGGFGNQVIIDHGGGVESIYGHLNGSYPVSVGQLVQTGDHIANVGATGVVTACHLDLKIKLNGEHTDPQTYLRARGVAI